MENSAEVWSEFGSIMATDLISRGTRIPNAEHKNAEHKKRVQSEMSSLICFHAKISRGPLAGVGGGPLTIFIFTVQVIQFFDARLFWKDTCRLN
jgi:hypothetical protein